MTKSHLAAMSGEKALSSFRIFKRSSQLVKVKSSVCEAAPEIQYDEIRVGRLLGKGGYNNVNAVTFCSKDEESNGKKYAIKHLRDSVIINEDAFTAGAADLVNESKLLQHLQHENIIKLHGVSEGCVSQTYLNNRPLFLILDRLTCSLADKILEWRFEEQKLSPSNSSRDIAMPRFKGSLSDAPNYGLYDRLRSVAIPVANVLQYLHSKKIIFRDLKPANIGFDSNDIVKLFDFGLAREINDDARRMTGNIGSPLWMAPEVALSKKYGLPADIYSFAFILWELTTLETPFKGFTREQHAKAILVNNVRPKVDSFCGSCHVQQLITDGWDRSPLSRPQLVEILSVLKSETALRHRPDSKATKTTTPCGKGRAISFKNAVAA